MPRSRNTERVQGQKKVGNSWVTRTFFRNRQAELWAFSFAWVCFSEGGPLFSNTSASSWPRQCLCHSSTILMQTV